jgi:hypothetical protein
MRYVATSKYRTETINCVSVAQKYAANRSPEFCIPIDDDLHLAETSLLLKIYPLLSRQKSRHYELLCSIIC